jgi:hypothetical protein
MLGGHVPEVVMLLVFALGLYTTVRTSVSVYRRLDEHQSPMIVAAGAATATAIALLFLGLWVVVALVWSIRALWRRGQTMVIAATSGH